MMNFFYVFWGLWLWRYTRLIVNLISYLNLKPIIPIPRPRFSVKDVTVVVSTLGTNGDLRQCLSTIRDCCPKAIILVTPQKNAHLLEELCKDLGLQNARVLGAPRANKRMQMVQGLREVDTDVIVFADDDVFWPPDYLIHLLAPFEDLTVGGVGAFNNLQRPSNPGGWDLLNAAYLKRWQWDVGATGNVDGGIACLSGRTNAIQTKIVQDPAFTHAFLNEIWFGGIDLIAADDDNFVTRWLFNRGWKVKIQCGTSLTTTLDANWNFINQCLRWTRTTWRSNLTELLVDGLCWTHPYCTYALQLSMFNPPTFIYDPLLGYCLVRWLDEALFNPSDKVIAVGLFFLWLVFAKTVKLWGHFVQYPSDLKYIPLQIAFGYFAGLIKIAALLTINVTSWGGSRSSLIESHSLRTANTIIEDLGSTIITSGHKATEKSGLRSVSPNISCNVAKGLV